MRGPRSTVSAMTSWFSRFTDAVEPEVVVVLPQPLADEVRALLEQDRRTDAVRLTRRRTRINLLPAVRAVDALASDGPGPGGRTAAG